MDEKMLRPRPSSRPKDRPEGGSGVARNPFSIHTSFVRRPLASALLALAASALGLAFAEPPPAPAGPSQELLDTACGSGLLLRRDGAGSADASAPDDDAEGGAFSGDAGLFGSPDGADGRGDKAAGKGGAKAKKPKTKLLRPRSDEDKKDCPDKVRGFYEKYGDQFSAVPAPGNLSTKQIEGSIDHVFDVASGPAQKQILAKLKGDDMAAKSVVVNKIFDGVGDHPLDGGAFGTTVARNLQGLSSAKTGGVLAGSLGAGRAPEQLAADAKAAPAVKAAADAAPDPYTAAPGAGLPGGLRRDAAPPSPGAIRPPKAFEPIPANVVPQEPGRIRQYYNNFKAEVGDYIHGSPIANYEGQRTILPNPAPIMITPGSDQSVSVPLPNAAGLERRCAPGCYGTAKMISVLVGMGQEYSAYFQGKRSMSVGGISKLGGGYFPPHVSHQKGIDADVTFARGQDGFDVYANAMIVAAVVRKLPDFRHINGREYILVDQSKHAAIGYGLDALVRQGNLTPEQAARGKSALVHWPNHNDHFHIRILP